MSAATVAPAAKNRQAWRDRPDTVLISIRRSTRAWSDWRWTPYNRTSLTYTVLGTRAECEASNGGAPVDPGVYGIETILTAWDLGLSQRRLARLLAFVHPIYPLRPSRKTNADMRYERKVAQVIAERFLTEPGPYRHTGMCGRGVIWSDSSP